MLLVTVGPNVIKGDVVKQLDEFDDIVFRIASSKAPPLETLAKIRGNLSEKSHIIVDFPGGKHRLNNPSGYEVKKGEVYSIQKSEKTYDFDGTFALYPKLDAVLEKDDVIVAGDGETAFKVLGDYENETKVEVLRTSGLALRTGMTLQKGNFNNITLTDLDYKNMECLKEPMIKGVMLSFVESAKEVNDIRNYIKETYSRDVEIYSKIETEKGINNAVEIAKASDYIVLARGDLLVQLGEEKFPVYQEKFLMDLKEYSDKVIVGTEVAESFSKGYFLSRAELSYLYYLTRLGYKNILLVRETTKLSDPVEVAKKVSGLMEYYSKI